MQFTRDQIIQLAPDDASAKAGQQLANASKWVLRCAHEQALWGDCQGSGSNPYKTMVDIANMAFKCSCPSRKFPCKHGLGLMLLYVTNPESFSKQSNLAPPVEEWLSKRVARAEAKVNKEQQPVDPEDAAKKEKEQAKRLQAREKKVDAGVDELRLWLKDIVRTGIVGIPQNAYQFAQNITARMVDAQAGGLAAQLRKIQKINFYQEGWQKELVTQMAKLYLLTEAFQKSENLPPDWQLELKLQLGWTVPKEEVLAGEGIQDDWLILSRTQEDDANLQMERIWLYGLNTERFALILNFYAAGQLPQHLLVPGSILPGELAFFPAILPMRALVKTQQPFKRQSQTPTSLSTMQAVMDHVTAILARNPLTDKIPVLLQEVTLGQIEDRWYLTDTTSQGLPISNVGFEFATLLARTRGNEFRCFAVYENGLLDVQAIWEGHQFHCIK